ncbi:hypothetical protein HZA43_03010 [Candidatus Peregrinibacteria bacterium]|nr:hypothetical protein [Candidatus Peregrinibacteria bacterium]
MARAAPEHQRRESIIPVHPTLSVEEQLRLLNEWKRTRDNAVYNRLFGSLVRLAYAKADAFCEANPWADKDDLIDDVLLPAVQRGIDDFDIEKSNGAKLSTYVFRKIKGALQYYFKCHCSTSAKTLHLEDSIPGTDDLTRLDGLGTTEGSSENATVDGELVRFYRVLVATALTPRQAVIADGQAMADGRPETCRSLGNRLGVSRQTPLNDLKAARATLTEFFERDEDGGLAHRMSVRRYLLQHFMPDLALENIDQEEEHVAKLAEAGVIFAPDGTIDLAAAGNNQFNITLFRMQNRTFRSGADLLEERKATSVFELFQQRCSDPSFLRIPRKIRDLTQKQYVKRPNQEGCRQKRDGEFTRDEILAATRSLSNMRQMARSFDLRKEGNRWTAVVTLRSFRDPWFLMNGGA